MRVELRSSSDEVCDVCGATELLYTATTNAGWRQDVLKSLQTEIPRWRWLKRRWASHMIRVVKGLEQELADASRKV